MALFSKRKKNEEFKKQLEREALDKMDQQGGILPFESFGLGQNGRHPTPAHVITAAELNGQEPEVSSSPAEGAAVKTAPITMQPQTEKETAGTFLYNRMAEARRSATQKSTVQPAQNKAEPVLKNEAAKPAESAVEAEAPSVQVKPAQPATEKAVLKEPKTGLAESKPFDLNEAINSLKSLAGTMSGSIKPAEEPKEPKKAEAEALKTAPAQPVKPVQTAVPVKKAEPVKPAVDSAAIATSIDRDISKIEKVQQQDAEQRRKTLLDRCNAYLADDTVGALQPDTSRYKLESVESILNGFEDRAAQKVLRSLNLPMPEKAEPLSKTPATVPASPKTAEASKPQKAAVSKELPVVDISSSSKPVPKAEPVSEEPQTVKHISFQNPTAPRSVGEKMAGVAEASQDTAATRYIDIEKIKMNKTPDAASSQLTQTFKKLEQTAPELPDRVPEENSEQASENNELPTADYRTVGDRDAVLAALNSVGAKIKLRTFANALLLVFSLLFTTAFSAQLQALGTATLFGVHLTLIILICLTNFPVFKSLSGLFSQKKSCETSLALAFTVCALSSVLSLFSSASLCLPLSAPVALAALFFSIGKNLAHRRIYANFNIIANEDIKNAAHIVANQAANRAMGQRAVGEDVLVCCGAKAKNFENFLSYSYCKEPLVNRAAKITLVGLIMAFGLGLAAAFITTGDIFYAFYVAGVICCLAAAPATLLITNWPLRSAGKKLNRYGAMLTGYKACAELDRCNAVAVPVGQLFPEGSVCMVDMRPLSPNPIDKTILDAYSVTAQIGSPLAGMFRQINNTTDLVPKKADTVMYEEKMGVSGWVENHRVFVGNRILMEAHDFKALPPLELDKKILRKGYFPVYLACDNAVCAIFVVKYLPDEEVSYELSRLCNTGTTVLIKNCDPNISEKMLCDYFGLYEESVSLMSKQGCDSYDLASTYQESRSAGAGFGQSVCGFFAALTAAIQIKSLYNTMSALYVVTVILGILAAAVTIFTAPSALTPIAVVLGQLISTAAVCLPLLFRRP